MEGVTLVTGGLGFIGSHVVDVLVEQGASVRVLDWLHPQAHSAPPEYRNPAADYIIGDVRDPAVVAAALPGVAAVSHHAAMVGLGVGFADAAGYVSHNDLGTAVLLTQLERAGFRGRVVLASSCVVYGESPGACAEHGLQPVRPRSLERLEAGEFDHACTRCGRPLTPVAVGEDTAPDPRNVYAATKLHQEHLCLSFGRELGLPVAMLRYHNVYGPRMPRDTPYAGVAAIFRSAIESGRPPVVYEDGRQLRDFVHVADVAQSVALALEPNAPGERSTSRAARPRRLERWRRSSAGRSAASSSRWSSRDFRLGDVRHVVASPLRAQTELGFAPRWSFAAGMAEFATAGLRAPAAGEPVAEGSHPDRDEDDGKASGIVIG